MAGEGAYDGKQLSTLIQMAQTSHHWSVNQNLIVRDLSGDHITILCAHTMHPETRKSALEICEDAMLA